MSTENLGFLFEQEGLERRGFGPAKQLRRRNVLANPAQDVELQQRSEDGGWRNAGWPVEDAGPAHFLDLLRDGGVEM